MCDWKDCSQVFRLFHIYKGRDPLEQFYGLQGSDIIR